MQKALLFSITAVKDNYFSEKLTLFNQNFAGLGPNTDSYCYISYDAEIAKGSNEFVNFYLNFFKNYKFSGKKIYNFLCRQLFASKQKLVFVFQFITYNQ
jgi:hypothetical protein